MSDAAENPASKVDAVDARHSTSSVHDESLRTYWKIFYWLMGLLVVTVLAAQVHLDSIAPGLNLIVAMIIATVKGGLVVLFFMHVKQSSKLTWMFATAAFIWLAILMALSFNDYLLREDIRRDPGALPSEMRSPTQEQTGADVPGPVAPKSQ